MGKVLIAHLSLNGHTEKVAKYIAEGIRVAGHEIVVKRIEEIKKTENLQGYDAYLFGCPTYYRDIPQKMKTFYFLLKKQILKENLEELLVLILIQEMLQR